MVAARYLTEYLLLGLPAYGLNDGDGRKAAIGAFPTQYLT